MIFLFTLAGLCALAYFALAGRAGIFIDEALSGLLGTLRPLLPIALIAIGIAVGKTNSKGTAVVGIILMLSALTALTELSQYPVQAGLQAAPAGISGGYVGLFLAYPLYQVFGIWASLIILAALLLIGISLVFSAPLSALVSSRGALLRALSKGVGCLMYPFKKSRIHGEFDEPAGQELEFEEHGIARKDEPEESGAQETGAGLPPADAEESPNLSAVIRHPKRRVGPVTLPLDLLEKNGGKPVSGDIRGRQEIIQKTLANFGIDVEMADVSVGPTVTQYTLRPAQGIKLSSITALANDLALALAAHPIRIEAPIPGKSLVGLEVPNQQVSLVRLREMLESKEWTGRSSPLTLAIGRDVSGKPWLGDLSRMPHLLVAGSTGSGKTVCLNAIIISLLYANGPDDLKLILIDPKRVELPSYNGIPHLLAPVITDVKQTVQTLRWAILEMEKRFELLAKAGARDLKSYNETASADERLPYLVIIVDELADLMVAAASEVEGSVIRLAQMARAVGMHLILATQRPSVEILTGLIKANITSRMAFSVASLIDSRTILDASGAEKLLGRGDMLVITAELSKPKRLQGVYVSDAEIKRVVAFLKKAGEPEYADLTVQGSLPIPGVMGADGDEAGDALLEEAKEVIFQAGKASASLLQRRLKIGYARAARILDLLEEAGFIGAADGAKPREILASRQ